jgi:hypothetical protein
MRVGEEEKYRRGKFGAEIALVTCVEFLEIHSSMDSPVIFKRKGNAAKPVQRVREKSPEVQSETDTDGGSAPETAVEESPSTLATKLKKKIQKSRPKSRLSFGGDDEVRIYFSFALMIELNLCGIGR